MASKSEFTEVAINMRDEARGLAKYYQKMKPVPFMEERLSNQAARRRFQQMTEEQRLKLIKTRGVDALQGLF